ncbi:VOC family protein [Novosphingobium sp. TH158]|uniref:VOC family protein n=1 Tax=Novosphingobium sp. TH158 TaxID=2067455 RepID=UPI0013045960|nr:VOC family protein [Novosphingobium sp. TH158]
MAVKGLDHVNILTEDLAATIAFYDGALGMKAGRSPAEQHGYQGTWLYDETGHPGVHVVVKGTLANYGTDHRVGEPTGAVHHVAFRCEGFREAQDRIAALGMTMRVNDGIAGLRQIMLTDPNGITIELNYPAG